MIEHNLTGTRLRRKDSVDSLNLSPLLVLIDSRCEIVDWWWWWWWRWWWRMDIVLVRFDFIPLYPLLYPSSIIIYNRWMVIRSAESCISWIESNVSHRAGHYYFSHINIHVCILSASCFTRICTGTYSRSTAQDTKCARLIVLACSKPVRTSNTLRWRREQATKSVRATNIEGSSKYSTLDPS